MADVKRYRSVSALLSDISDNDLIFFNSEEVLGTGAITSIPIGGRYLAAGPTLVDGGFHELRIDNSGRLLVNLIGEEVSNHDDPLTATGVVVGGMNAVDPGGTFGAVAEGDATRLRASLAGIQYAAITDATGVAHVSIVNDNAAAPATPAGMFVSGIYRAASPTYTDGDGAPLHFGVRGRLLVSLQNITSGNAADVDTDDSAAATNPTGVYALTKYEATLPVYTDGDAAAPHADSRGRTIDRAAPAGTGATTSVAGAAADTPILSANTDRIGATFFNDSSSDVFVLLGSGAASSTNFTRKLGTDGYYDIPGNYTGEIRARWVSATGSARITELTT